jgi:5-methylcytosine-specific restriction endonuclease McrA
MASLVPDSAKQLVARLRKLRSARRRAQALWHGSRPPRRTLGADERKAILAKTGGRCHVCGGRVNREWRADHVFAYRTGVESSVRNYLAAHALCNAYRWDYSPQEFQWILKIGIWARLQMEKESVLGEQMLEAFHAHEMRHIRNVSMTLRHRGDAI